jgi:lipoate-protein ligase B
MPDRHPTRHAAALALVGYLYRLNSHREPRARATKITISISTASAAIGLNLPVIIKLLSFSRIAECNVKDMRKRRVKKAGKKLDVEAKAVVWPELFQTPRC